MLKLGITLADANPSLAKSTIDKAIAGGVFASASDSALLPYEIAAPNFNQLYQNLKASGRNDFVGAVTLINSMKASNDQESRHITSQQNQANILVRRLV